MTNKASEVQSLLKRMLSIAPYVIFLVALFFTEYYLFGVEDALLGIVFQSFARTMVESVGLSFVNYLKHACLFLIMSLCSSLFGLHPSLLVVGSALYMFTITVMNSDDYLPRNFFMLGLGFLLLEIYPIGVSDIPQRLLATLFAIVCTTLFVYGSRFVRKESELVRDRGFVMRAFDDIGFQLIELSNGQTASIDPHRTFSITQEYCRIEYGNTFRQGGVLSGRQRYTFMLLVCAEQVADMIRAVSEHIDKVDGKEKAYFLDLSEVFLGFGKGRIREVHAMIQALEAFLDTHALENLHHDTAWRATLESLVRTLCKTKASRDNSTPFAQGIIYRLKYIRENLTVENSQLMFAVQLALIVGLAFAASEVVRLYFDTQFGPWIPITAFMMLYTYRDETVRMMERQLLGMVVGMIVFVAAVHFLPEPIRLPCVLVLGYTCILMDFGPMVSMAAGTQMALVALYPTMSLGNTLLVRLVFVLIGALVVVSVIFLLLQARRAQAIAHKVHEMGRVDERLLHQIRIDIDRGGAVNDRTIQLMYYLHMNADMLGKLAGRVSDDMALEVERLTEANYQFAMDAAHAVVFLNSDIKRERMGHLKGTTQKLRLKLEDLPLEEVSESAEAAEGTSDTLL